LWSARILADQPQEIRAVHESYVDAGARVVVTASYQVSREGFVAAGRTAREADNALRASVLIAREAVANRPVLVAASIGPYGAILHDGSEYRGRYGVSRDRLVDFHAERLAVINEAQPDVLAIETIPDVEEIDALMEALATVPHLTGWVTVTCADTSHTSAGQRLDEVAAAVATSSQVSAVGVNCTAPVHVSGALTALSASCDLPLVAYPNAGGDWDPEHGWRGAAENQAVDLLGQWCAQPNLGLLGGCCGVGPTTVGYMAERLATAQPR